MISVCKPKGILFFTYISTYLKFVQSAIRFDNYLLHKNNFNNKFELNDNLFTFSTPEHMEQLLKKYNTNKLNHVSLDGITRLIKEKVNSFTDEEFIVWIDYLKTTSEIPSILGYSEHILYICQKISDDQKNNILEKERLMKNLEKLKTTTQGIERIKRNVGLNMDVVDWCKQKIKAADSSVKIEGKNWYVISDSVEITINMHSFTIITAHKITKERKHGSKN